MARIRTIKPEYWQDEKLAPLPPIDRLVFLGLISQADDAGRLVDNVRLIDGLLFPCTDDTCRDSLDTLARLGRVVRYRSASGQRLLQIANWTTHQYVDKPAKYVLPAPTEEDVAEVQVTEPSRDPRETPANVSRDGIAPIPDLRPTTNTPSPSAREALSQEPELRTLLGEHAASVDTLAASATHSRIWAAAVVGMFGPTGTYRHILSGLAPPDEGLVVSRAMDDYAAKGGPFDAKYFRGFVENAVKERKRELGTGNGNGNGRGPSGEGRAETPDRGDNDWSHLD